MAREKKPAAPKTFAARAAQLFWLRARLACEELPEVAPAGVQGRIDFSSMSPEDRAALRPILERLAGKVGGSNARAAQGALETDKTQELVERYEARIAKVLEKVNEKERKAEEVLRRARERGIDLK
jgi:hypothetical protein